MRIFLKHNKNEFCLSKHLKKYENGITYKHWEKAETSFFRPTLHAFLQNIHFETLHKITHIGSYKKTKNIM